MALSGVNRLCRGCTEDCKQWKQVVVVRCPFYQQKPDAKEEKVQISSMAELK